MMHQLFSMEDILYDICSYMVIHDLSALARVSSSWFRCAVPHLYREVNLYEALSPFGDMRLSSNGYYSFLQNLGSREWERFIKYSPYVRILYADQSDSRLLLPAMSRCRAEGAPYLFPNLQFLKWSARSDRGLVDLTGLISPSLEHFCLRLHDLSPSFFSHTTQLLTNRLSTLHLLQLDLKQHTPRAENSVVFLQALLSRFGSTLTWVQIPGAFHTAAIAESFSKISKLCQLTINVSGLLLPNDTTPTGCNGQSDEQGFTSLQSFSYGGTSQSLYDAFLIPFRFTQLVEFYWYTDVEIDRPVWFANTVANTCTRLRTLVVGDSKMYLRSKTRPPIIPWHCLRPLLECKDLVDLSLPCFQISMTLNDLIAILLNRTTWRTLMLYSERAFSLMDILLYLVLSPNIQHIGMFIDTRLGARLPSTHRHNGPKVFPHLTTIDFAFSVFLPEFQPIIARVLFQICKNPPKIVGWKIRYCNAISKYMASWCIRKERLTRRPMSIEALLFVLEQRKKKLIKC